MNKEFVRALKEIERKLEYPKKGRGYFYSHKKRYIESYKIIGKVLKKEDRILDIGSVPCHFIACLKRMGYNVVGVDKDPTRDKKFISQESLNIKRCDIEKNELPFKDNSFDKIIFNEILEHLYINPIFALKEVKRVLKKGGKIFLTTPNGYSLKRIFYFLTGRGLGEDPFEQFNKLFLLGYYGHVREYSIRELKIFLKKIGFSIEKIFFIYSGHYRLKKLVLINSMLKLLYKIFYPFRTHIIIIAKK